VTETEAAAQAALQQIVQELDNIRGRLTEIHERLPVPSEEAAMLEGQEEMDIATEIRSVIECVLSDSLRPAIRDLAAAASYRPKGKGKKSR